MREGAGGWESEATRAGATPPHINERRLSTQYTRNTRYGTGVSELRNYFLLFFGATRSQTRIAPGARFAQA